MKKKKIFEKLAKRIMVAVVLFAMIAISILTNVAPIYATNKSADEETIYSYEESLGHDASTEFSGRVWTDKSVFDGDATFADSSQTVILDTTKEDFLVSFSALATSQAVKGEAKAALDVVFVIDMSNSMNNNTSIMSNGKSRLVNMVDALNTAVESILATSENARIGVVAFNGTSTEILPLDHYTKYTETVTVRPRPGQPGQQQTVLRDFFELNGTTINTYAINSLNQNVLKSTPSNSGTNIQKGVAHGMSLLTAEDLDTTVQVDGNTIQRVPTLVLLSDGEPTSSSDLNWWNMANETKYYDYEYTARADNAMKVLMTAGYMKKQINANYAKDGVANNVTVYTVGVGLEKKEGDALELARISLTPEQYLSGANVSTNHNTIRGQIYNGLTQYFNGYSPTVAGFTFMHPNMNDLEKMSDVFYSDYYKDVADTGSIAEAFENIVADIIITNAEVPTEMDTADPLSDGYVTYTDPIGQYMEIKDIKGIIYDHQYYPVSYNSTTKAVTIDEDYLVTTSVHGEQQLSHLDIEVTEDANGNQTLTIAVPAALIPLRINSIELNTDGSVKSNTSNKKLPIRVVYSVGLQDDVMTNNGVVNTNVVGEEYIKANTNLDGSVNFYSNMYDARTYNLEGHDVTIGNATAVFEPAHSNAFYYVLEDTAILKKVNDAYVQVPSTEEISESGKYYYYETYYYGNEVITDVIERTGTQLKKTDIITIDGFLYRAAGSPRLNRILRFEGSKTANVTNTASEFYVPTFEYEYGNPDPYAGKFVVLLGNNGVLNVPSSGTLEILKDVVKPANSTPSTDTFTFKIDFNGSQVLTGSYPYTVVDAQGSTISSGEIKDGGSIRLKDGYVAHISGLPHNTTYTVTEESVAGFTTTMTNNTGTIVAGEVKQVNFTNTYTIQPSTINSLSGSKLLDGRGFDDEDIFSFEVKPLTSGAPAFANPKVELAPAIDNSSEFDFGSVTFTVPGTYVYQVLEVEPAHDNHLAGITYSRALYQVTYYVTDNGDGTLNVDREIHQMYDDTGNSLTNTLVNHIAFTNKYDAEHTYLNLVAMKNYTDTTGNKPLVDGMFSFTLTPVNGSPMPKDDNGNELPSITVGNVGNFVAFPEIEYGLNLFSSSDKLEFQYEIREENKGIDGTTINGMIYDQNVITVNVEVVHHTEGAKVVISDVLYSIGENAGEFNNTYAPTPVTITLEGEKLISGRDWLDSDEFKFTWGVTNNDAFTSNALRNTIDTTNIKFEDTATKANPTFDFGTMIIKQPGTYQFYIKEVAENIPGITYDPNEKYVTIVVEDNGKGSLEYTISYDNGSVSTDTTKAIFKNIYEAQPTDVITSLTGTKELIGKSLIAGEFYFEVYNVQTGQKTLVTHTNDTTGSNITFVEGLTFDKVGTYEYLIKEQIPTSKVNGTTYDETIYRYTITVTDNLEGELEATTKLEMSDDNGLNWVSTQDILFSNEYEPTPTKLILPTFTKVIDGNRHDVIKDGEFEFALSLISANPTDGIVLPTNTSVKNDENGFISFDDLTFTKAGVYTIQVKETPGSSSGMTYDDTILTATITVTDDRNGNLTATYTPYWNTTHFTNKYESKGEFDLTINKELTGREWKDTDKFEFEIVVLDPSTQKAIDNGHIKLMADVSSRPVLEVTKNNQTIITPKVEVYKEGTYKFIVREVTGSIEGVNYDSQPREVVVEAIDNNDGTITCTYTVSDSNNYGLTFKNNYDPDSTHISGHDYLTITKEFDGRGSEWLDTDEFTFVLAAGDPNTVEAVNNGIIEMPSTTLRVSNSNKAHPHFGDIIFHDTGTFTFIITEQPSNIPGVTNDPDDERTIIVKVTDDGNGELVANIDSTSDHLVFTNTYSYTSVTIDGFEVTKDLVGRDWLDSDRFDFVLNVTDEVTYKAIQNGHIVMPADLTITATKANQTVNFGDITFKEPGTYKFAIRENKGNIDGVSYDSNLKEIIVVVSDKDDNGNPTGTLTTDVTFKPNLPLVFTNVYTPKPVTANIEVVKELVGLDMKAGKFRFRIIGADGSPMPQELTITNGNNPSKGAAVADFGSITYTQPGTYKYQIVEVEGTLEGVTYDKTSVRVDVVVTYDASTGLLNATVNYFKNDNKFTNTYKGTPTELVGETHLKVTKHLVGRPNDKWLAADQFTFTLAANTPATQAAIDAGNIVMPNTTLAINVDNKDNAHFGNIVFKEAGDYEFVITEQASNVDWIVNDADDTRIVKVKVTDSGVGKLVVVKTAESQDLTYTNKYVSQGTLNLEITKVFTGRLGDEWLDTDQFEFEVVVLDQTTQTAIDSGLVTIPSNDIVITKDSPNHKTSTGNFVFKAEGTYKFIIREENNEIPGVDYDDSPREVTVVVTDTNNGAMNVNYTILDDNQAGLTFTNTYDPTHVELTGHTDLVVNKVFTGRENNAWLATDKFTFTLAGNNPDTLAAIATGDIVFTNTTLEVTSANKAHAHFGNITFKTPGNYQFVITELSSSINGVIDDTDKDRIINICVEDTGNGYLTVEKLSTSEDITFTNTYSDADVVINKKQAVNSGTKTTAELKVRENNIVTYYLTITNNGQGNASDVVISDKIPEGLTLVDGSITDNGILTEDTITWTLDTLEAGQSKEVSFSVTVPDVKVDTEWKNIASVTYKDPDGTDGTPDESEEVVINQGAPKVVIVKTQALSGSASTKEVIEVKTGDILEYVISVTNTGSEEADNVVISDVIPEGLIIKNYSNGTLAGNEITWQVGTIVAGGSAELTITVEVPETTGQFKVWTNIAEVEYDNDPVDPNPDPSNPVSIFNSVDGMISATKTLSGDRTTFADNEFEFELNKVTEDAPLPAVTNVGNTGTAVSFGPIAFNAEGTYVYAISEVNGGQIINGVTYDDTVFYAQVIVSKDVTSSDDETVTTYAIESINYFSDEACTTPVEAVFNNTYYDANVDIEKAQSINDGEKTTDKTIVRENDKVTYYLTVTNNGQGDASDVVITDAIPQGLTLIDGSISDGGLKDSNNVITWTIPTLAAGETKEVNFSVLVPDVKVDTTWTNIASITYKNPDGNDGNPDESDPVVVEEGAPKVNIVKRQAVNSDAPTDAILEVVANDIVTYYIIIENVGTEIAEDVVVKDVIPTGLTLVDGSISNHGHIENGEITWTIDNLPVGEKDSLTFQVKVPSVTVDTLWKNIATITYTNNPEDPTDPTPSNEVEIKEGVPELVISKQQSINDGSATSNKVSVVDGDKVTYIITVTNNGTGAATDVVITDDIPTGLTLVDNSITENGVEANGTITWTYDRIEAGASVEVRFAVMVPEVEQDTVWENIATVVNDNDPNEPSDPSNKVEIEEGVPAISIEKLQSVNNETPTKALLKVEADDEIMYTIKVKNIGTEIVKGLIVTEEIPEGLTLVDGSINENGLVSNNIITWEFDTLAVGEEVVLQFTIVVPKVDEDTTWTNIAVADFENDPTDPNSENDIPSNPVSITEDIEEINVNTGDENNIVLFAGAFGLAAIGLGVAAVSKKKKEE